MCAPPSPTFPSTLAPVTATLHGHPLPSVSRESHTMVCIHSLSTCTDPVLVIIYSKHYLYSCMSCTMTMYTPFYMTYDILHNNSTQGATTNQPREREQGGGVVHLSFHSLMCNQTRPPLSAPTPPSSPPCSPPSPPRSPSGPLPSAFSASPPQ